MSERLVSQLEALLDEARQQLEEVEREPVSNGLSAQGRAVTARRSVASRTEVASAARRRRGRHIRIDRRHSRIRLSIGTISGSPLPKTSVRNSRSRRIVLVIRLKLELLSLCVLDNLVGWVSS